MYYYYLFCILNVFLYIINKWYIFWQSTRSVLKGLFYFCQPWASVKVLLRPSPPPDTPPRLGPLIDILTSNSASYLTWCTTFLHRQITVTFRPFRQNRFRGFFPPDSGARTGDADKGQVLRGVTGRFIMNVSAALAPGVSLPRHGREREDLEKPHFSKVRTRSAVASSIWKHTHVPLLIRLIFQEQYDSVSSNKSEMDL